MRQRLQGRATVQVPEMDPRIISPTGEQVSLGGKGQAEGALGLPARPEQGITFDVPQLDAAISAPAGEQASVRADGDGEHGVGGISAAGLVVGDVSVLEMAQPIAGTRPYTAVFSLRQSVNNFILKAGTLIIENKSAVFDAGNPVESANPQAAFPVLVHGHHHVACQAILLLKSLTGRPVPPAQAMPIRADPQAAFPVLVNCGYPA